MQVSIGKVHEILAKESSKWHVPVAELIELQTNDPFKVLVATILSARTKDQTTSAVCERLFAVIKKPEDFEALSIKEIEQLIYPVGFYRNKARFLKQLPGVLKNEFSGKIPETIEELLRIPGVGRKTANLVRGVAFGKPAICVDTHVHRITNRLGYVRTKTPHETEMALRKKLPKKYWISLNTLLVALGQNICTPLSPWCSRCPIGRYCGKVGVTSKR